MYPPPYGPPPRRRHRYRVGLIAAGITVVALVGIGVAVYVQFRSTEGASVAELRRFLDRVPLPAGAVRTSEDHTGANIDNAAYLERDYRLETTAPGPQLRALLAARGFHVVGRRREGDQLVTSSAWSTYAGAASGDVDLRPPGTPSGILDMRWSGAALFLTVTGGDVDD